MTEQLTSPAAPVSDTASGSSPGRGLVAGNFKKIALNGFGDPLNAYPHSMVWFNGHLFVGTTRANLASRGYQIRCKTPKRLGEMWPVPVPPTGFENDLRAQIWRYAPSTEDWSKIFTAPTVKGVDGFDVPLSIGFRCMTPFQGLRDSAPALYTPTWGTYQTPTTYMFRSESGDHFDLVSEPGNSMPESKPWGLRGLIPFKGRLFTSPAAGRRHESNIAGLMAILVTDDPTDETWRLACEPQFGDCNNLSVFQMAVFNNRLYAGTLNIQEGFQIWRTDAEGDPPFTWTKILSHGAYRGKLNQIAMTFVPFNGALYVGTGVQNGGFDFDNNLGPAAPEIIRVHPDDSWELVMGEPRLSPRGLEVPLSGLDPGFCNPFAGYLWSMCVHDGWLYAGTSVWTIFLRYFGKRDRFPKVFRQYFSEENIERLLQGFGGCDLWRTMDGVSWTPVTVNGFGNTYNLGFRTMVSTPHGLFVGAANPFAPDVAVRRLAGWVYENNPRGGLEIWLGSHTTAAAPENTGPALNTISARGISPNVSEGKAPDSSSALDREIHRFYGDSGFRHFGFWRVGTHDALMACEELMAELLAFLPEKTGALVEVGCNLGASSRTLLRHFAAQSFVGLVSSEKALAACVAAAPEGTFRRRRFPRLDLPAGSADVLIWAKGSETLGDRRELLRQAFSVLKPGGRLAAHDFVYEPTGGYGFLPGRRSQKLTSVAEYKALLERTGFADIRMVDCTAPSLLSFRRHVERYIETRRLSWAIAEEWIELLRERLLMEHEGVRGCVLFSCVRPHLTVRE